MFDVPNLQRRVYDVAVAATECNQTQAHSAREAVINALHGGTTVWGV